MRGLKLVACIAIAGAGLFVLLGKLDEIRGIAPEQVVEVYRTHGCRCAFSWARELEAEGFVVRLREVETLQLTRQRLHTPAQLRGCHVAKYLEYFVEGHVGGSVLHRLATRHPNVLGVAVLHTAESQLARVEEAETHVFAFDTQGRSLPWEQVNHGGDRT